MQDEPLIVRVIQQDFPDWEPPTGYAEWLSCLCPFHGDTRPSASVSYENNAFVCHACGEKGDAIGMIMRREGVGYREAIEAAERISPGIRDQIQRQSQGQPGRRVFGGTEHSTEAVRTGVRRRSSTWS